jgi:ferritin-like metal-binding protein YciE
MKIDKFEKYKRGDFKLTNKHLFEQQKLIKLRNYIIRKNNLFNLINQDRRTNIIGGADDVVHTIFNHTINMNNNTDAIRNDVRDILNGKGNNFIEIDDLTPVFEKLKQVFENSNDLLKPADKNLLYKLIESDNQLTNEFIKYNDFTNENFNGLKDKQKIRNTLIKIQKGLFDLQVKTIFNKLKQLRQILHERADADSTNQELQVDINPLLEAIENKIRALNNYIEKQDEAKNTIPDIIQDSEPHAKSFEQYFSNEQAGSNEQDIIERNKTITNKLTKIVDDDIISKLLSGDSVINISSDKLNTIFDGIHEYQRTINALGVDIPASKLMDIITNSIQPSTGPSPEPSTEPLTGSLTESSGED